MTDDELIALHRDASQSARDAMAQAAVLQDLRGRQLSVLRHTYPGWDIGFERDPTGRMWWTAELRQAITLDMVTAGVAQCLRQPDAIALAATLAWQSALVHNCRAHNLFGT
ncbi:hypothetical protein ACQP2T_49410 [Nonomuraea sp. CA-143628]|uniref:hypothetical protein n=1 Tax=Nonomuraea sp. CA-143628 TaxID=3239997 RepID=UPI003D8BE174